MKDANRTRWAIFSDTHGNPETMRDAMIQTGPFDAMIHLGDGIHDAIAVSGERNIPLIAVSGNEDGAADYPERLIISMGAGTALLLHGHRLDIHPYLSASAWEQRYAAMDGLMALSGARILLFGHTHLPVIRQTEHGIICNPGSHYIGSRTEHTFAVAEANGDGVKLCLAREHGGEWIFENGASLPGA